MITPTPNSNLHRGGGMRRWLLVGSLALNIFLIAFLAVGTVRQHQQEEAPRGFREMMHFMRDTGSDHRFLHHLSETDAAAMQRLRADHGAALTASRQETVAARNAVRDALLAGAGNEAALRAAIAQLRAARLNSYETFEPFLIDLGEGLSTDALTRIVGQDQP